MLRNIISFSYVLWIVLFYNGHDAHTNLLILSVFLQAYFWKALKSNNCEWTSQFESWPTSENHEEDFVFFLGKSNYHQTSKIYDAKISVITLYIVWLWWLFHLLRSRWLRTFISMMCSTHGFDYVSNIMFAWRNKLQANNFIRNVGWTISSRRNVHWYFVNIHTMSNLICFGAFYCKLIRKSIRNISTDHSTCPTSAWCLCSASCK